MKFMKISSLLNNSVLAGKRALGDLVHLRQETRLIENTFITNLFLNLS